MGIIWFWGGEHNTTNEFDVQSNASIAAAKTGMSGSYCLNVTGGSGSVSRTVTARQDYYVSQRIWADVNVNIGFATFYDGATAHIIVRKNTSTGFIEVCRGTTATVLATGTIFIGYSTTYHVEIYCKIDDSDGRVIVKVNGVQDIDYPGDTRNAGSAQIDKIVHGNSVSGTQGWHFLDDLVYQTDTWPGDVRVAGKEIIGDGSTQQWYLQPSGVTAYVLVNDTDDTDYIYTNQNFRQELFQIEDVTEPVYEIKAFKTVVRARTEGSPAPTQVKFELAAAGVTALTDAVSVTSSYTNHPYVYETNPLTGNPFTVSDINNLQVGIQSNDPSLVAQWRFESEGSKYANSVSSYNYLTPVGGTLYVDTDYVKEGLGSIKYWYSYDNVNMGYLILEDANASADFPLRAGDTQKLITMCGWVYPTTVSSHYPVLFGKAGDWSGQQGIGLQLNGGTLYVLWSYASTPGLTVNQDINTNLSMNVNRWYHVAVTADGVNKACLVRLYDAYNDTASTANLTASYQMVIDDGTKPFRIGNSIQGSTYYGYRGYFDDIRVYNRRLGVDEIDLIRQGVN